MTTKITKENITNEDLKKILQLNIEEWEYNMIEEMLSNDEYKKEMLDDYWEWTFSYLVKKI